MTQTNETYSVETAKVIGTVLNSFLDEQAALVDKYRIVIAEKFMGQELQPTELKEIADKLGLYVTETDEEIFNASLVDAEEVNEGEQELEESMEREEVIIDELKNEEEVEQAKIEALDADEIELSGTAADLVDEDIAQDNLDSDYQITPEQDAILTAIFENFKASLNNKDLAYPLAIEQIIELENQLFETGLFPVYNAAFTDQGLQFALTPAILDEASSFEEIQDSEYYQFTVGGTDKDLSIPARRFEFLFGYLGTPDSMLLANRKNGKEAVLVNIDEESFDKVRLILVDPVSAKEYNWALHNVVEPAASQDIIDAMGELQ